MPPASHPRLCTSLTTPSFVVATSVADCRDERIIHEVIGQFMNCLYNFAHIDCLWAASKIYRENNCFYCSRWRLPAAQRNPADMGPQDELLFNRKIIVSIV